MGVDLVDTGWGTVDTWVGGNPASGWVACPHAARCSGNHHSRQLPATALCMYENDAREIKADPVKTRRQPETSKGVAAAVV